MNPAVTVTSSGVINLNVDQGKMMGDFLGGLWKVLSTNGNRWKLLIVFAVIFFIGRMKARDRRKARENKEREKARIWKEEMKK